ncbi:MAG: DUF6456 domain-containing protein [Pseudomonadota bacterium]
MTDVKEIARVVPGWVPKDIRNYVFHTEMGQPIRALARSQECHASTIMRQIRKVEQSRDDPLIDRAIKELATKGSTPAAPSRLELLQALRRLATPKSMLALAVGMEQGVIVQDNLTGEPDRGVPLPSVTATALALRGWIAPTRGKGRVLRYRITQTGRSALRDLTAEVENTARAMAEGPATFDGAAPLSLSPDSSIVARMPMQESPVAGLARRRDKEGNPFLTRAMVRAAERLREDFELAQIAAPSPDPEGARWADLLNDIDGRCAEPVSDTSARGQVAAALLFLGPGLAEVALRCCCLLEGLETAEQELGWAARSGKVVLRIALQRLVLHYDEVGHLGPKIG